MLITTTFQLMSRAMLPWPQLSLLQSAIRKAPNCFQPLLTAFQLIARTMLFLALPWLQLSLPQTASHSQIVRGAHGHRQSKCHAANAATTVDNQRYNFIHVAPTARCKRHDTYSILTKVPCQRHAAPWIAQGLATLTNPFYAGDSNTSFTTRHPAMSELLP